MKEYKCDLCRNKMDKDIRCELNVEVKTVFSPDYGDPKWNFFKLSKADWDMCYVCMGKIAKQINKLIKVEK